MQKQSISTPQNLIVRKITKKKIRASLALHLAADLMGDSSSIASGFKLSLIRRAVGLGSRLLAELKL